MPGQKPPALKKKRAHTRLTPEALAPALLLSPTSILMLPHGHAWFHLILNSRGSWNHGDPRGFRSRKHRIHSSGDYKSPPPVGEHSGLLRYRLQQSQDAVRLSRALMETLCKSLLSRFNDDGCVVLAIAGVTNHVHLLQSLPCDLELSRKIIGRAKGAASRAVSRILPGKVWAQGHHVERIKDRDHQRSTFAYILRHDGPNSWRWSFRDG